MTTQIALYPSPGSSFYPDTTLENDDTLPRQPSRQLQNSQTITAQNQWLQKITAGKLPISVGVLIAYITWLISELLDVTWEDVLKRAGVQRVICTWLHSRAKRQRKVCDEEVGELEGCGSDGSESVTSQTSFDDRQETRAISRSHRVKRQLKTCLRLRDQSKVVPLRATGCKGSRRSNGEETSLSVKWGCDGSSESESGSGSTTPLESVFLLETVELESMGVEMEIVRDSRLAIEDEEDDDEDEEADSGKSALATKLVRRV